MTEAYPCYVVDVDAPDGEQYVSGPIGDLYSFSPPEAHYPDRASAEAAAAAACLLRNPGATVAVNCGRYCGRSCAHGRHY